MKQFGTILKFELGNYFRNKVFVGVTVFLVLLIAVVMFFPRIAGLFKSGDTPQEGTEGARPVLLLSAPEEYAGEVREAFAGVFGEYEVRLADGGGEEVRAAVASGRAACAFVLDSLTSYTYYVDNLSIYDENTYRADTLLQEIWRISEMTASGIPADRAEEIMSAPVVHESEALGKDQSQNFLYTYIMIMALYMVILLYGQMVATGVATEKSSRAMELLITSVKPVSMMFGKVLAACLAGLIQLVCVFGSAILFFNLNKEFWGGIAMIASAFNMPASMLVYMLLFFVLGFLVYAFMYGAIGSTASKLEDINTSVMPVTMLFVIAFIVVITSMEGGNVDSPLMRICSYVPFTSPIAMFTRIVMSTVPWYEIAASVAILAVSVVGIGVVSARIYRVGVLLYGKPPKIGSLLKMIRKR